MTNDKEPKNDALIADLAWRLAEVEAEQARAGSTVELIENALELEAEQARIGPTIEEIENTLELEANQGKAGSTVDEIKEAREREDAQTEEMAAALRLHRAVFGD